MYKKRIFNCLSRDLVELVLETIATAANIGFAARLAGHWSNGHFIAVVLHLGWTFNLGLLFVNLYFYIFNQQRFRADEQ